MPQPCSNLSPSMPCAPAVIALTMLQPCPNLAPTTLRQITKLPNDLLLRNSLLFNHTHDCVNEFPRTCDAYGKCLQLLEEVSTRAPSLFQPALLMVTLDLELVRYFQVILNHCHTCHTCLYNKSKMFVRSFVRSFVRMGISPLNTNEWKEIEQRFLHQNVDTSLGQVSQKESTIID